MSASEAESSGYETMIETLSNLNNVSSIRNREAGLIDPTQNENGMQVWAQRVADNTIKEMAALRKEIIEKLEKMMREMKNNRRMQSIPIKKNNGQTTSRIETPKHINNDNSETNVSDTENQENRRQDNPFRPSETNELRTLNQTVSIQNLHLDVQMKTVQKRMITVQKQNLSAFQILYQTKSSYLLLQNRPPKN